MNKKDRRCGRVQNIFWCVVLGLLCVVLGAGDGEAVAPKILKENSQSAFAKGETEGISLTREGTLVLAPKWDVVADTGAQFVWSLEADKRGVVYMGTGIDGRIYAFKPNSQTPELIFDAEEETEIFALAVGPDGALYAGTSPNGLIYRIVQGKPAEVFCQTGDLHVWALLWQGKTLYAATGGEQGRILKCAKNKTEVVYQSADPNVVSLALGQAGDLYAGTDQNGLIYKVSSKGQVSVFYDAGEKEIHAIAVNKNGMVYAAAMVGRSENKKNGNGNGKDGQSVVYAIRPSGSALRLWEVDDPLLVALKADADGSLRAVTGKQGRVYRIWPDGTFTLLAHLKDAYPWAVLFRDDGGLWIGSSGDGRLFEVDSEYVSEGMLTSEVKDFTLTSYWGQAHWQFEAPSGTDVVLQTRSGNRDTPDDTWSAWSTPLKKTGETILSHPARFLQYRVVLKSSSNRVTPAVGEVQIAGLQENIAPMVLAVRAARGTDNDAPPQDRRRFLRLVWDAGDVNDDQLVYALSYREMDSPRWLLLKEDLKQAEYVWDTETVPDGRVQVRVVASDRGSNPVNKALSGQAMSGPLVIDNTAPRVTLAAVDQVGAGTVRVLGEVEDQTSSVVSAKYAVNSGQWQVIFAQDTIFDAPKEGLHFEIEQLKPGFYTLVVLVEDALGNVGVGKTLFEVK